MNPEKNSKFSLVAYYNLSYTEAQYAFLIGSCLKNILLYTPH